MNISNDDAIELLNSAIRALGRAAGEAGDLDMVRTCGIACGDDEGSSQTEIIAARKACLYAIRDAGAQS